MEIELKWSYLSGSVDTKTVILKCLPARGKWIAHPDEIDADLCIVDGSNICIASIHTGIPESSNALCEEIVRRFNEFPEELKR